MLLTDLFERFGESEDVWEILFRISGSEGIGVNNYFLSSSRGRGLFTGESFYGNHHLRNRPEISRIVQ